MNRKPSFTSTPSVSAANSVADTNSVTSSNIAVVSSGSGGGGGGGTGNDEVNRNSMIMTNGRNTNNINNNNRNNQRNTGRNTQGAVVVYDSAMTSNNNNDNNMILRPQQQQQEQRAVARGNHRQNTMIRAATAEQLQAQYQTQVRHLAFASVTSTAVVAFVTIPIPVLVGLAIISISWTLFFYALILQYWYKCQVIIQTTGFGRYLLSDAIYDILVHTNLHDFLTAENNLIRDYGYLAMYFLPGMTNAQLDRYRNQLSTSHQEVLNRPGIGHSLFGPSVMRAIMGEQNYNADDNNDNNNDADAGNHNAGSSAVTRNDLIQGLPPAQARQIVQQLQLSNDSSNMSQRQLAESSSPPSSSNNNTRSLIPIFHNRHPNNDDDDDTVDEEQIFFNAIMTSIGMVNSAVASLFMGYASDWFSMNISAPLYRSIYYSSFGICTFSTILGILGMYGGYYPIPTLNMLLQQSSSSSRSNNNSNHNNNGSSNAIVSFLRSNPFLFPSYSTLRTTTISSGTVAILLGMLGVPRTNNNNNNQTTTTTSSSSTRTTANKSNNDKPSSSSSPASSNKKFNRSKRHRQP